jgi:hypothetical protein
VGERTASWRSGDRNFILRLLRIGMGAGGEEV